MELSTTSILFETNPYMPSMGEPILNMYYNYELVLFIIIFFRFHPPKNSVSPAKMSFPHSIALSKSARAHLVNCNRVRKSDNFRTSREVYYLCIVFCICQDARYGTHSQNNNKCNIVGKKC